MNGFLRGEGSEVEALMFDSILRRCNGFLDDADRVGMEGVALKE